MTEIIGVAPGSPAAGKIEGGEYLTAINGHPITDVLDYQFHSYDAELMLATKTAEGQFKLCKVEKEPGADLGLSFATYLMDAPKSCANQCIFCFIDQLPQGMRETLYFKDDDARLSFLTGNYITLTNLTDRELKRIIQLKISPINISVHATDPGIRERMMGNKQAGRCMEIMRQLAAAEITMNAQIVLCPGINDSAALQRSMIDLADFYPHLVSVSVVPVGLTRHREGLYPLIPVTRSKAKATIAQVEAFAAECLKQCGSRIFFCSDELYLKAGLSLPDGAYYEGYPQIENGVGLLTSFQAEFLATLDWLKDPVDPAPFSIATGTSAAPFLENLLKTAAEKYGKIEGQVYPVENDFFGQFVNVAGLLTGQDIAAQLQGEVLGERLFIPTSMLRHGEGVLLDDMTTMTLSATLGVPVIPVEPNGEALLRAIYGVELEQEAQMTLWEDEN